MSRFWRSSKLVALCRKEQQSIGELAAELEEESSLLFQPSTPAHVNCEQTEAVTSLETISIRTSSARNEVFDSVITGTTQTFITTTSPTAFEADEEQEQIHDIIDMDSVSAGTTTATSQEITTMTTDTTQISSSNADTYAIPVSCSVATQDISLTHSFNTTPVSPVASDAMLYLNDQTGCFEPVVSELERNDTEENEIITSETRKRKSNQNLRLLGMSYKGHKIIKVDDNSILQEVSKDGRTMRDKPCNHGPAKISDRSFSSAAVNDVTRIDIFQYFWQLSTWDAIKSYINGLIQVRNVLRRRKSSVDVQKKSFGFDCYLPTMNGEKVRVCRDFFLATFDLKKDTLQLWIRSNANITESCGGKTRRIDRGRNRPDTKTLKSDSANEWLECVPKVPSHYCRANSSRIYVEESFESFSHMHSIYTSWCLTNNKYAVRRKRFREILGENKISIYKPRKDQCDTCVSYKQGNIPDDVYQLHIIKKNEARAAKTRAIEEMSDDVLVVSMDMQSVLLCPKLLVSKQYYKMKLALHNYTIYVKNTKDVYLYIWHEGDGGVTANNVISCIVDFVERYCDVKQKVIMISDGCAYQNKNKILASALANVSVKKGIVIEQIILEKGHTMMEVDSVHSTLEKKFKPPIFSPSDYVSRMRQTRPSQPYIVNYLDFNFFKNYETLPGNYSSIRPGRKVGDATVTDIRGLLYDNGELKYKLRHSDDWDTLPQRRLNMTAIREPTRLYNSPLKIDTTKFNHLQSLKQYMHLDYHLFYDNLNY